MDDLTAKDLKMVVNTRLASLGLTIDPLIKGAQEYYLAWASSTPHHPMIHAGFNGWSEAIRSLRDDLKPKSWTKDEVCGVNYVVSADGQLAITTATGNEYTGLQPEVGRPEPRTKNDKGPRVQAAVKLNVKLLNRYLYPEAELEAVKRLQDFQKRNSRITWVLLVHVDHKLREIRSELSLPTGMSEDDCIDSWRERIILPSTRFDEVSSSSTDKGPQQSPEITIDIKRIG